MRRRLAALALALALAPGTVAGQEPAYTVDELATRCEASEAPRDCLMILYAVLVPEAGRTPPPPEDAYSFEGTANQATPPFDLSGGEYVVRWTARSPDVMCFHSWDIQRADGELMRATGVSLGTVDEDQEGETYLYGVEPGRHYFEVISGCDWTLAIERA